jgi:hypothetical protein
MSVVLTRPPPKLTVGAGSRKVYTLHSSPNNVFAWNLDNELMKTATVVFKRRSDAAFMAEMIEKHVLRQREWPNVSVVDNVFSLYGSGTPTVSYENNLIEIKSWELEDLRIFCVTAYLDMISLSSIDKNDEIFRLNGELLSLTIPIEFYVDRLNSMYHD